MLSRDDKTKDRCLEFNREGSISEGFKIGTRKEGIIKATVA